MFLQPLFWICRRAGFALVVGTGLFLSLTAQGQVALTKVSAASLAGSVLSPGGALTVNFQLAQGASPAVEVDFEFSNGLVVGTTNPASGVATTNIPSTGVNGSYSLQSITVVDTYGRTLLYDANGRVSYPVLSGVAPAAGPTPNFAAVAFTLSGGLAVRTPPTLTGIVRANSDPVTAGSLAAFQLNTTTGSSPILRGTMRIMSPDGAVFSTNFNWDGTGRVYVATDPNWLNGKYYVQEVTLIDANSSATRTSSDGSGIVTYGLTFTVAGGVSAITPWLITTLTPSGSAALTPGQTRGIAYAATPGTAPLGAIEFRFTDPTGFVKSVEAHAASGSLSLNVGSDWVNGTYTLTSVWVTDPLGRYVTYLRNQTKNGSPTGSGSHAFNFSAFDFTVSGAVSPGQILNVQSPTFIVQPGEAPSLYIAASWIDSSWTVQWYMGQSGDTSHPIGTNSTSLHLQPLSSSTSYWVRLSRGSEVVDSGTATMAVNYPKNTPTIYTRPLTSSAHPGQFVGASVYAVGPGPLSYQWYKDGVAVPGATTPDIRFPSVALTDNGTYVVVISNSFGSTTSEPIFLGATTMPQIVVQPVNQTVRYGDAATFTVVATGGALHYSWGLNGSTVPGSTGNDTPTFTIPNVNGGNAGTVQVQVYNTDGSVLSNGAALIVTGGPLPEMTVDPTAYGTVGQFLGFDVRAQQYVTGFTSTGLPPGMSISSRGDVGGIPTTPGVFPASVTATNAAGTTTVNFTITIFPGPFAPVFSRQPLSQAVALHGTVVLKTAVYGTNLSSFQWQKNGQPIPNAGGDSYTMTNVDASNAGDYTLVVWGSAGMTNSSVAHVVVDTAHAIPFISTLPLYLDDAVLVVAGDTVTLGVGIEGSTPMTYQWVKNGIEIAGATGRTLTVSDPPDPYGINYGVKATNAYGTAGFASGFIKLTTLAGSHISPATQTVAAGQPATISVVSPMAGATIQWYRGPVGDKSQPIPGANAPTLNLTAVTTSENYWVLTEANYRKAIFGARVDVFANNPAGQSYFGTIGSGGQFGLFVRNLDGFMIGILPGGRGSFVTKFQIGADGSFSLLLPGSSGGTSYALGETAAGVKAAAGVVLGGQISNGVLSGTILSTGEVLNGAVQPTSGSTAGFAGYYEAPVLNTSATMYFIVGTNGLVAAGSVSRTATQAVMGTAAGNGQVTVPLAGGTTVLANFEATSGMVAGQFVVNGAAAGSFAGASAGVVHTDRLVNISTRGLVGDGEKAMFAGFVISGTQPKSVLIRANGPTLTSYGVSGAMDNPVLKIFRDTSEILSNDDWGASADAAMLGTTATRLGAFAQKPGGADAAIMATLAPGVYSAQISRAAGSQAGIALVEVYDSGIDPGTEEQKVVNISTRGEVGTGENVMIAGFVISGNVPKKVLIRGVGPTLGVYGVGGVLANPELKLYQGSSLIASNDDWGSSPDAAMVADAAAAVGGFALGAGSKDAALLISLAPGIYSAQVSGVSSTTGVALLEVYEVP